MTFYIVWIAIIVIIAILGIYSFVFSKKVKEEGIETIASVSRIEEQENIDVEDHMLSRRYTYYISYNNQEGRQIEAMLSNPNDDLKVGSRIRIKYLPGREEYPVMTEMI